MEGQKRNCKIAMVKIVKQAVQLHEEMSPALLATFMGDFPSILLSCVLTGFYKTKMMFSSIFLKRENIDDEFAVVIIYSYF